MENQDRLENLYTRLRAGDHRLTPQRVAILNILVGNNEHPSIEDVYERVKKDFPMTSQATVYKTVHLLKEMGEIREISISNDRARYDGGNMNPHPHLICTACRNIIDIEMPELTELAQEMAEKTNYEVGFYRLDFFGICPQCQNDEKR